MVCPRGSGFLTCERELSDEGEEDGRGRGVGEEARGKVVFAGDEGRWVALFDEGIEAVGGAKVLSCQYMSIAYEGLQAGREAM